MLSIIKGKRSRVHLIVTFFCAFNVVKSTFKGIKSTWSWWYWYLILAALIVGIFTGIFLTSFFVVRFRQRRLSKKMQKQQSSSEENKSRRNTNSIEYLEPSNSNNGEHYQTFMRCHGANEATYEEVDITMMKNGECYESMTENNGIFDETYQGLEASDMSKESHYQSLMVEVRNEDMKKEPSYEEMLRLRSYVNIQNVENGLVSKV